MPIIYVNLNFLMSGGRTAPTPAPRKGPVGRVKPFLPIGDDGSSPVRTEFRWMAFPLPDGIPLGRAPSSSFIDRNVPVNDARPSLKVEHRKRSAALARMPFLDAWFSGSHLLRRSYDSVASMR
jgi:hypothetical protein